MAVISSPRLWPSVIAIGGATAMNPDHFTPRPMPPMFHLTDLLHSGVALLADPGVAIVVLFALATGFVVFAGSMTFRLARPRRVVLAQPERDPLLRGVSVNLEAPGVQRAIARASRLDVAR